MFMTIYNPLSHTMLPKNIDEWSTAEYMHVLRRSLIPSELHRVLCSSSSKDNTKYVPYHIKMEVQKINEMYADLLGTILKDEKELFLKSASFQHSYTKSWNTTVTVTSQMVYLDLSKRDKISNNGAVQVLVELLHDCG